MPKPKRGMRKHPLRAYMDERGIGLRKAGKALKCHFTTLHHICKYRNSPQRKLAQRIVAWSGGQVTFEHLFGK